MIHYEFAVAVIAGAALAVPFVLYARRARHWRRVFAAGLIGAALIYVVFAGAGGSMKGLLIEVGGVVLFGAFAVAGVRRSSYLLALGWVTHVAWDLLLHPLDASSYAPRWYPVACIGFDLVVAGALCWWNVRPRSRSGT